MSAEQPQEEPDIGAINNEHLAEFGAALGLDPEFLGDVQIRGIAAVIDRAIRTDESGALPRLLAIIQVIGDWIEEETLTDEPPPQGAVLDAIADASHSFGVPPQIGVRLVGSVMEVFSRTAGRLGAAAGGANVGELGYAYQPERDMDTAAGGAGPVEGPAAPASGLGPA